jgi:hypothetical protein
MLTPQKHQILGILKCNFLSINTVMSLSTASLGEAQEFNSKMRKILKSRNINTDSVKLGPLKAKVRYAETSNRGA